MSAPSLRLFLVRHGETSSNRELRYLGSLDEPLTPDGLLQAESVADILALLAPAAVYASPLRRAAQTGGPIAARLGLPLLPEPRLREQCFGAWEGLRRAEVVERGAAERALLAAWESDPTAAPPGGESLAAVAARVHDLADELAAAHPGGRLVLVSHVGPIKALLCTALAAPLTAVRRLFLDPGTLTIVDWGDPPVVRLVNAHGRLDWQEARWRL